MIKMLHITKIFLIITMPIRYSYNCLNSLHTKFQFWKWHSNPKKFIFIEQDFTQNKRTDNLGFLCEDFREIGAAHCKLKFHEKLSSWIIKKKHVFSYKNIKNIEFFKHSTLSHSNVTSRHLLGFCKGHLKNI